MATTTTSTSTFIEEANDAYKNTVAGVPSPVAPTTEVEAQKVTEQELIKNGSGQVTAPTPTVNTATAGPADTAAAPKPITTDKATTTTTQQGVNNALAGVNPVEGQVSDQSQATAATQDPSTLSQLQLEAAQLAQAQQVANVPDRTLQEGELIDGSSVDQTKVDALANQTANAAQTADPSEKATVQGQLNTIMSQFDNGGTPPWAASAIRNANAAMAARGLSASSLAGQTLVQAALESAMPIAQADAATYATFELQNLSNKQQAAMLAAEQRAQFLGVEFDQNFQTKALNASTITQIANKNYDASVQIALENANLAQSVDLANLNAKNAKILADAAAMTQMDMQNLSNEQQAAIQNAQAFLQMDLANADREQQTTLFKAQERINSLMTDAAAKNATSQFNASSENQTKQFMSNLQSQVEQFNTAQVNANSQFNANQLNNMAQFKAQMQEARLQFNATNRLVVDQANAQWRQTVSTNNNQNTNEANRLDAQNATTLTAAEYNNLMQARRDSMQYILTGIEGDKNRGLSIVLQQMESEAMVKAANAEKKAGQSSALWTAVGSAASNVLSKWTDKLFK